jgi:RNA polymerase sigma-70 factor, ECF subfamily
MEVTEAQAVTFIPTNEIAFEQLFTTHFKRLYAYALTIVKEEMTAEEMVQNVFFKIWEKKGKVDIQTSVTAYLYRSVYNESLNYLKHKKVKSAYQSHTVYQNRNQSDNAASRLQLSELQQKLDIALSELPEQCRTIFQMSRFEELKYQEIADKLGISIKTVENQMGKALKILRVKLADYLPILLFLLIDTVNPENLC